MKIGDYIKAESVHGFTVIRGKYIADLKNYAGSNGIVLEQPNGVLAYVSPTHFILEVISAPTPKRSRLEVELLEKIEEFRGMGHSDEYIVEQFEKVLEGMK